MKFPPKFYRWRPHPWHGLEVGPNPPQIVHAYIEITPFDLVKYEIDKSTGYIRVDRPQQTSSQPPSMYGFIPRTFCGEKVGALSPKATQGDGDPLDICVVSERPISRPEVILNARVVGGLQAIDGGEADDKIIAVLENDNFWGDVDDISELPANMVDRLKHYFETYKLIPGKIHLSIEAVLNKDQALKIVEASMEDYELEYGS
jgi:inorganic pyrophosphatase